MINDSEHMEFTKIYPQSSLTTFAKIIEKLSGNKSNIKITLQEVKLNTGKATVTLNGEVNFNIFHAEDSKKETGAAET